MNSSDMLTPFIKMDVVHLKNDKKNSNQRMRLQQKFLILLT